MTNGIAWPSGERRKSKDLSKDLAQDRPGSIPAQGRKIYIKMLLHRLH